MANWRRLRKSADDVDRTLAYDFSDWCVNDQQVSEQANYLYGMEKPPMVRGQIRNQCEYVMTNDPNLTRSTQLFNIELVNFSDVDSAGVGSSGFSIYHGKAKICLIFKLFGFKLLFRFYFQD